MRYELYFRDVKIGDVTEDDADFPSLRGTINYDASMTRPSTEEQQRLARFLELNRYSFRLVDVEHEQDVAAEFDAANKELEAFDYYIESDEWLLIAISGERLPILCPFLRHDGGIVWRWNPKQMGNA